MSTFSAQPDFSCDLILFRSAWCRK